MFLSLQNNHTVSNGLKYTVVLFLFVFLNFTFSIQYINLNSFDVSLTEEIEEEEEETEIENEVLEHLLNDALLVNHISFEINDEHIESILNNDVQTPPPKLS